MEHIALYRKYRPKTFKEVVGQDAVVTALSGALKAGKISHAYLFAGSRGTGKTSIARIFARELGSTDKDTYEIDAASNRGIDDIRALRDAVLTLPFDSKYKVYIVDEVHMLTKEAFNALLKTLEEPPSHVVFILATTEMQKLPETIVSRCQVFEFKRPSVEIIRSVVSDAAKSEGLTLEGSSAELIAIAGDGSFRDAYGILERVMASSSDKKITSDTIESATGAPKRTLVVSIISALAEKKWPEALAALRRAAETGSDVSLLSKLLIVNLRAVLMLSVDPKADFTKTFSEEDIAFAKKIAATKSITAGTLLAFLSAHEYVSRSPLPELPLELAILSLAGKGGDQPLFS
jgi:DNA polymerase-3 subunit gamma/tau